MRDLAARLREVVERERAKAPAAAAPPRPAPLGELTYIPDPDGERPFQSVAAALGGSVVDPDGACVMVERRWPADRSHGRKRIEDCAPGGHDPLHLFNARLGGLDDWWRRVVYFDIETTGLSGGAGTLAFLAGCGWFDDAGFTVRQFLLAGPSGERAMLDALGDVLASASLLVTYNGRTFDVPFMETRWAFHRREAPTGDVPHFDMLPPARRLWRRREADGEAGCSLSTLERAVLDFHRTGDVPGFEIPARYFLFLRTGNPTAVEGVLDHNRHDIVSLAVLMAHALWLVREGPDACRTAGEQAALGSLYARAGDTGAATVAFERAAASIDPETRRHALAELALLLRRERRYDEAAGAWQNLLELSGGGTLRPIERQAVEALAIHHEHRRKDAASARRYAQALARQASGRLKDAVARRLERIDRKLARQAGELGLEPKLEP
jgi:hypothetical protein